MAEKTFSPAGAPRAEKDSQFKLLKKEIILDWDRRSEIISRKNSVKYGSILISATTQKNWEYSIALTRKVKGAVKRNRIKRIIREVYRQSKINFTYPMAVIFTVTNTFDNLNFTNFKNFYISQLRQFNNENYK